MTISLGSWGGVAGNDRVNFIDTPISPMPRVPLFK
jgi:hypothetical protein